MNLYSKLRLANFNLLIYLIDFFILLYKFFFANQSQQNNLL